jgi:hypothetical protein
MPMIITSVLPGNPIAAVLWISWLVTMLAIHLQPSGWRAQVYTQTTVPMHVANVAPSSNRMGIKMAR